ncbi:hypothetical protein FACS1894167_03500 [Synergistales bacterium]|nr:hypothetical protein FACS1894167_03500 [Synergistales bacterium]GHV51890.1 hypothetical protein FACS1894216_06990 [Synergistales bacterium]
MGTVIVGGALFIAVTAIIRKIARDAKNGKCCGCDKCGTGGDCDVKNKGVV